MMNEKKAGWRRKLDRRLGLEAGEAEARHVFADFRRALEREHRKRTVKRPRLRLVAR